VINTFEYDREKELCAMEVLCLCAHARDRYKESDKISSCCGTLTITGEAG
jgi:hypothetical protein